MNFVHGLIKQNAVKDATNFVHGFITTCLLKCGKFRTSFDELFCKVEINLTGLIKTCLERCDNNNKSLCACLWRYQNISIDPRISERISD